MPPNNSIFYIIKHHSTVHTKQCLYIIPYFRVFCKRVTHIFLKIFIAVELGAFLHRLSGAHELRQRVRPFRAAPFLHRLSGARELRQRVRPDGAAPFPAPAERGARTRLRGSHFLGCPMPRKRKRHRSRGASPFCGYVGRSAAAVAAITAAAAGIITTGTAGTAAAAALTAAYPDQDDQDDDPPPGIFAPEAVRRTHTVISSYQRFHYILW